MKSSRHKSNAIRCFAIFVLALVFAGAGETLAGTTVPPTGYTVVDLGTLYGLPAYAVALNNVGQVVGTAVGDSIYQWKTFLWDPLGGTLGYMIEIPGSNPTGINDAGSVSGTVSAYLGHASLTFLGPTGIYQLRDLHDLEFNNYWKDLLGGSWAKAINNSGQIAIEGLERNSDKVYPLLFTPGSAVSAFGDTPMPGTMIFGINKWGDTVGEYKYGGPPANLGYQQPALWGNGGPGWGGGATAALGTLPNGRGFGVAFDINDSGQIVGIVDDYVVGDYIAGYVYKGVIWNSAEPTVIAPGVIFGGLAYDAFAKAINNFGQVVGQAPMFRYYQGGREFYSGRAFLWHGCVIDLNSMVTLPSGMVLKEAVDINNKGWIVANGSIMDSMFGQASHAFLLKPPSSFPAPTVCQTSPASGPPAGGTPVTITGAGFANGATVKFGGSSATLVVVGVGGTTITTITPAHSSGPVDVVVTNPDEQSGTYSSGFTYNEPPVVDSVVPSSGLSSGGTSATITGSGFTAGATVAFGGSFAWSGVVSGSQINAITPAHTAGPVDVVVTNPDGQSDSDAGAFTYISPPTVGVVSPASGSTAGGTAVLITGTDFSSGATVSFGGTAATSVVVVSGSQITAITPPHAAGAVSVVVTNTTGLNGTRAGAFTYFTVPTISSIKASSGATTGGTKVTIAGTNFAAGAAVTFGGIPATSVVVVSGTKITGKTPANVAGAVNVTVTNVNGGSATLNGGFTYIRKGKP